MSVFRVGLDQNTQVKNEALFFTHESLSSSFVVQLQQLQWLLWLFCHIGANESGTAAVRGAKRLVCNSRVCVCK